MSILKSVDFKLALLQVKYIRPYRFDLLIVIGLAIAIAISTYLGTYQLLGGTPIVHKGPQRSHNKMKFSKLVTS